jgi:probable HAF family extracellular repeat protein
MNVKHQTAKNDSKSARTTALLALSFVTANLQAQSITITPIVAPGTPFSVTALNGNGQVAGYFFDAEFNYRAFFWSDGAAQDLGTLGGSISAGYALNNAGQIAGVASITGDSEFHAFVSVGSSLFDLGTLGGSSSSAHGLNDAGTVVGQSDFSPIGFGYLAFRVHSGGALESLGTLGGSYSSATRINNAGQVIGYAATAGDMADHAFLHTGGVMLDLGTLGGLSSSAYALNESGQVTGESGTASGDTHAFLFDGTVLRDLGTLGGTVSRGLDINSAGQAIGNSTLAGDIDFHGFIYSNGVLQDLGTLGGTGSTARDINNHGQVVGTSTDLNWLSRAFLWENGTMTDLNTLLPANSGWELTDARFINDNRQIVGEGYYQGTPAWFLLSLGGGDENQPPVANAGPDQSFACGVSEARVTVDGSASSDPDGDALTFEWFAGNVSIGTGASLSVILSAGSYAFTLRVTDPAGATSEDSVVVVVGLDTIPPVVECPAARTLPAGENGRAPIPNLLEGLVASDNCSAASALVKEQSPAAGTVVRCGTHIVTLTVVDAAGNHTTCSTTISVVDVTSPVVNCPEEIFRRARTNCQAAVPDLKWRLGASDNCTPRKELVITQEPAPGTLVGVGRHEVRFTVTDVAGNRNSCSIVLNVFDWSRPVFTSLTASPNVLRPANGQMVPVTLTAEVKDNCDPDPACRIVRITSSERPSGSDDIDASDWRLTGDMSLELRAEITSRRGPRVYTILVACTDASGNTTLRSVHVRVPRN